MRDQIVTCLLVNFLGLALASQAQASPPSMTRQQIRDLGHTGLGYSYWWGHARWRLDGQQRGSCAGSCPNSCTHSGSYGADCSGYVGKAWQVPDPSDVTRDWHPYSTWHFVNQRDHWSAISRGSCALSDALVYNESGAGHIVLFESGDPWGYPTVTEARGCVYGVVRNSRSFASKYGCIRRHNLNEGCTPRCEGNIIVGADCGRGDCSVYGAYCHQDPGAAPRCIFGLCQPHGENHACLDERTKVDCLDGNFTLGDCSAYGAYCHQDPGQDARCILGLCQPHGENHACLDERTKVDCKDGNFTLGDCSAYGAYCYQDPGQDARCVFSLCAPHGQSTGCLDERTLLTCTDGGAATGDCGVYGAWCHQAAPGEAFCVSVFCVPDAQAQPFDHHVCLPDGRRAHCTARGGLEDAAACPAGSLCQDGTCVSTGGCQPACGGRECGPEPSCGTSCGQCAAGFACDPAGRCQANACQPACAGRECGPEPSCGTSCGQCAAGFACDPAGRCQPLPPDEGLLHGVVRARVERDGEPGVALGGASVWVVDGPRVAADAEGGWQLLVPAGTHELGASAEGHQEARVTCQVEAGQTAECELVLVPATWTEPEPEPELPPEILGGCASVGGGSPGCGLAVLALLAVRWRARRG
jgi:hypothetical protein